MPTQALPPRRPTTPQERDNSTDDLQNALGSVLGVAANVFIDRPGFIASDDEVDPISAAARAVSRLNCRRWAAADKSQISPRVNGYNSLTCGPYLASLGEEPEGGDLGPEFTGGQCLFGYDQDIETADINGNYGVQTRLSINGPITSKAREQIGPFNYRFTLTNAAGGVSTVDVGGTAGFPPRFGALNPQFGNGPDNCGNPEATYQPPGTVTPDAPLPPGVVVNLPGIGDVTVNVDLSPDGDPVFTIPDIGVDFTIDLGGGDGDGGPGGGDPGGEPGGGDPGDPTDPGSPGESSDSGEGGDSDGVAPVGTELVGLLVQVTSAPQSANTFDNNAETVYRGIGYVRMGYPGRLGVDITGGTVISPQFFHAQQRGLTAWAVRANVGFNLRTTPYYRELEP